ncbi:MAG: saccharopine dehydrogenase C-terminal domain-containing protein, partial [Thermodesulfobacteriota bacterium]
MNKRVCVLGAGLVAGPLVRYLLERPGIELVLADQDPAKARGLIDEHPSGKWMQLDIEDRAGLIELIAASDLVVSLLPFSLHPAVAGVCLDQGRDLITASYVKPEMQALDQAFREKGLIFLNEMGVDPGLDHMAAMRVIDRIKAEGGEVSGFFSYCGGLPSRTSNNVPLGYKFSWSPSGVMLAAKNDGRYLSGGQTVEVPAKELFKHYWFQEVPGAGVFEAYVNRDALPYKEIYSIPEARGIYRGTLRNIGHCESWDLFRKLGLLEFEPGFDPKGTSPRQVLARLAGSDGKDLTRDLSRFLGVPK